MLTIFILWIAGAFLGIMGFISASIKDIEEKKNV